MANHKIGDPWKTQYPRRADGGWDKTDVLGMLKSASDAALDAERNAQPGFDPLELHDRVQEAMSRMQEADDMLCERYVIDRDVQKAGYIKANKDAFVDATRFLEEAEER